MRPSLALCSDFQRQWEGFAKKGFPVGSTCPVLWFLRAGRTMVLVPEEGREVSWRDAARQGCSWSLSCAGG